ncbi:MAG: DUF2061 domain-containing protein [Pseudomonadota bacterium]
MDSPKRAAAKALSWQITGLLVMSAIGYALTGSLETAGSFALINGALGFAMFFLHERIWARVRWGRGAARPL